MVFAVSALALPTHNAAALALTANCLTAFCLAASVSSAQPPPSELSPSVGLSEQNHFPCQGSHGVLPLPPGTEEIEESDRYQLGDRFYRANFPAPSSDSASLRAVNRLKKVYRLPSPSPLPAAFPQASVEALQREHPPVVGAKHSGEESSHQNRELIIRMLRPDTGNYNIGILPSNIAAPAGKPPSLRLIPETDYQAPPSISVGVPFAYGLSLGSVGIGLGLQERTRYTNAADGGMGISIGLGNPQKLVGFDVGVSIFDLSDFASRGSISFKLHRAITNDFEVAVGWQNSIVWGSTDAGTSFYGVLTKTFRLQDSVNQPFSLLVVSAGMGSGQFRSESDIYRDIESVGAFGSASLRVAKPLNAIAEWTGQDLTLGLSWVPFPKTPLVLTGGVTDLTGNAGDGSRLIFRVGYILSF